jgi:hypothetical protein
MIYAKKMMLVSPDAVPARGDGVEDAPSRIEPPGSILSLDNEMQRILGLNLKSDFEKWTMYKQVLQRFVNKLREKRELDVPETDKTGEPLSPDADTHRQGQSADIEKHPNENGIYNTVVADSFATQADRNKAKVLINILKRAENVAWDNSGHIKIGNSVLESNLHDLLKSAITPQKKKPGDWDKFKSLLNRLNVPVLFKTNRVQKTKHVRALTKWRPY